MMEKKNPYTIPSNNRRELIISIAIAVIVLGGVLYGIMNMGGKVSGNLLTGTITAKRFIPLPEEQVTIGTQGIHARKLDGEYIFDVDVKGHPYNVWVDKAIYEAHKVGDSYAFVRP